jgi:tetratricopeptide (TPR) repeat protein
MQSCSFATETSQANQASMRRAKAWKGMIRTLIRLGVLVLSLGSAPGSTSPIPLTAEEDSAALPPEVQSHIGKGYEFVQNGKYQQAVQEFQKALDLDPGLARVRYQLGVSYFALQQWPESRREFERLRRETNPDPAVVYYLGRLDLQEDNLEGAISQLEKIAVDPPFPDTSYYLGSAYLKKGRLTEAETWLKKAVDLNPRDFRAPEHLARVYLKAGRRAEAEQQFAVSSERRQHYNDAARQAVDCVQELTKHPLEEARAVCRALFDPDDPDKLTTLGMIYGEQGYYLESLEPFEKAAALDPDSFETNYNLGLSYFRLKRYAEAQRSLMKAVDLRPDFFASNALLGATLFTLKEDEAAYPVLAHAYELNPQDGDAASLLFKVSMLLAQQRWSKKEYRESMGFLLKANALRPDDTEVQKRLSEVKVLLGTKTGENP